MIAAITAQEAARYFNSPSQRRASGLIDDPEDWMHYRATGGVCGAFHENMLPGVWMGHLGALPEAWGALDEAAAQIVGSFAAEKNAARIIGWVRQSNRPMLALCRRIGFEIDGILPLAEPVAMVGWRPEWAS